MDYLKLSQPCTFTSACRMLRVVGAKTHNLKDVDVTIPWGKITVITGPSGSGKTSLAFDTIFVEGQRQYMEGLSTFSRQFLRRLTRPNIDSISGVQPTVAFERRDWEIRQRSCVATLTEIHDYLRILYAKVGIAHCYECGRPIYRQTVEQIEQFICKFPQNTRFILLAPIVRERLGSHKAVFRRLRKKGFSRVRVDNDMFELEKTPVLDPESVHSIEVVVDRLILKPQIEARLLESLKNTLQLSNGLVCCLYENERKKKQLGTTISVWKEIWFSTKYSCPKCGICYDELVPRFFSFNSPLGACPKCNGVGKETTFDENLLITDWHLTLNSWVLNWGKGLTIGTHRRLHSLLNDFKNLVPDSFVMPLSLWSEKTKRFFFDGIYPSDTNKETSGVEFIGLTVLLEKIFKETKSEREREYLESFRRQVVCRECGGTRLKREVRTVTINGKNIAETVQMTVASAYEWFSNLKFDDLTHHMVIHILKQITDRLKILKQLRLSYLTLDRSTDSLSGGELQRVRLTTALGKDLAGVCYILDEPTAGLHPREVDNLLEVIRSLRKQDNTVIVVEHNEKVLRSSDWMINLGPGAGRTGGKVVSASAPGNIAGRFEKPTGTSLKQSKKFLASKKQRKIVKTYSLSLEGVQTNNLKNISVTFPLGTFICVTGVSGSGKSSLIMQTLVPAIQKRLHNREHTGNEWKLKSIRGASRIDKLVVVDQLPLSRSLRSNPVSYSGMYDEVRKLFSSTDRARWCGFKAGRFSFNVAGGRCETCQGLGVRKIESVFFQNMYVSCPECEGRRFNQTTLDVKYRGKSIADVLEMSFEEAKVFFTNHQILSRYIDSFLKVGLGYLKLGQSFGAMSGGEAQRVKLATELANSETSNTLYVLDEPTVGLHPQDVKNLLMVLDNLVTLGNTVIVVEHSLEVMKFADWIVDLGPEGGEKGGNILAFGTPEEIASLEDNATGRALQEFWPYGV